MFIHAGHPQEHTPQVRTLQGALLRGFQAGVHGFKGFSFLVLARLCMA